MFLTPENTVNPYIIAYFESKTALDYDRLNLANQTSQKCNSNKFCPYCYHKPPSSQIFAQMPSLYKLTYNQLDTANERS